MKWTVSHLNKGLSSGDLSTILLEITDNLAGDISSELTRVIDSGQEDGVAVEDHAETQRLLL